MNQVVDIHSVSITVFFTQIKSSNVATHINIIHYPVNKSMKKRNKF